MSEWKNKLLPSEAQFMQEIVDQVPAIAQGAIVSILQKLADGGKAPKYRYFVISDGDVRGTNDRAKARQFAVDEDMFVVDSVDNQWLVGSEDDDQDSLITEAK